MSQNVLVLGGTTEATQLCRLLADLQIAGMISFAGRVERPIRQPLPQRIGGFGGAAGLAQFLREARITHLVDATHPFASQMSVNAAEASARTGVPLVALTRPAWQARPEDQWTNVPDIPSAVAALDRPAANVMLAVGRMHLVAFAPNPQHRYLLRLVDPPKEPLPLPNTEIIVDRGPFDESADIALMQRHSIDLVVSKNAGGSGAVSKIIAARRLGLPVIMIARPQQPERREVHDLQTVIDWLHEAPADLGV